MSQNENPWREESILKELLHKRGLSQKQTSEELGCSEDTIRYWREKYGISRYTPISAQQHEMLTGALMGDASVTETSGHPKFVLSNTNCVFLSWFYNSMNGILNPPHQVRTAEECAEQSGGDVGDYSAYYAITGCHPEFQEYECWYSTGQKRFPENLELTPDVVKVWYACDGSYRTYGRGRPRVSISVKNESDRGDYLMRLFEEQGFNPTLSNWDLIFETGETEALLEWLGEPVPGFEYKWGE